MDLKDLSVRDLSAMEMIKHRQTTLLEGQNNLRGWLYTVVIQNVIIILEVLVLTLLVATK